MSFEDISKTVIHEFIFFYENVYKVNTFQRQRLKVKFKQGKCFKLHTYKLLLISIN